MAKRKLKKFAELETFSNVFQPEFDTNPNPKFMDGEWVKKYFNNNNPLILEVGCGKGEYTIALAERNRQKNYIGIDVKGDRLWRGSVIASEKKIVNAAFLRIQANYIDNYFAKKQVDEIWITFPDPQPNKPKTNKRLTSPYFLERYSKILKDDGVIHLKTDNAMLFNYTLDVINEYNHILLCATHNLYNSNLNSELLSVQTYYETMFRNKGFDICYLEFKLNKKS